MHNTTSDADELAKLSQEISLLREQLQVATSALGRIEKRLKLVFPAYEAKKKRAAAPPDTPSQKSRDELMRIFEELLAVTRAGGDGAFAAGVRSVPEADLVALAFELAVSDRRKISVAKATTGIRGRIQESLMLSGGLNPLNPTQAS
jgi:hypothetical protein